MNPSDFVYHNAKSAAMKQGMTDSQSAYIATEALDKYKRSQFKKPSDVFKWVSTEAKRRVRAAK